MGEMLVFSGVVVAACCGLVGIFLAALDIIFDLGYDFQEWVRRMFGIAILGGCAAVVGVFLVSLSEYLG